MPVASDAIWRRTVEPALQSGHQELSTVTVPPAAEPADAFAFAECGVPPGGWAATAFDAVARQARRWPGCFLLAAAGPGAGHACPECRQRGRGLLPRRP